MLAGLLAKGMECAGFLAVFKIRAFRAEQLRQAGALGSSIEEFVGT
jgi:hypothetical protein